MAKLMTYDWPGNIRELENVIERAVLFCDESRLGLKDLTPEVRGDVRSPNTPMPSAVAITPGGEPLPKAEGETTPAPGEAGLPGQGRAAGRPPRRGPLVRPPAQNRGHVTRR